MKKRTLVLCLVLGSLALLGTLLCLWLYSPKVTAKRALIHSIEDLFEREEISSVLSLLDGGSVALSAENQSGNGSLTDGLCASGKLYFGKDRYLAEDLQISRKDISIHADLYSDHDRIYLTSDDLLGGSYGMLRDDMVSSFEDSIFSYNSGSRYALSYANHKRVVSLLRRYEAPLSEEAKEEGKKYPTRYLKLLLRTFDRHVDYDSKLGKFDVGGERITARRISVTVDANALRAILVTLREELAADAELRAFAQENEKSLYGLFALILTDEEQLTPYDSILARLDDIASKVEELLPEPFVLELVTPILSSRLMTLSCRRGETPLFALDVGEDGIRNTDQISVVIKGQDVWDYTVSTHTDSIYEATLRNHWNFGDGRVGKTTVLEACFDREAERFRLAIGGNDLLLEGRYLDQGNEKKLYADKVARNGRIRKGLTVSAIFCETDSFPPPLASEQFTPLHEITEAEADSIKQNLTVLVDQIKDAFFDSILRNP